MKIVREPLLAPPAGMNWRMIWSSEVAGCDKMDISGRKLQRGGRRARAARQPRKTSHAKTYGKLNYNLRQIRIFCPRRNADAPGGLECVTDKLLR